MTETCRSNFNVNFNVNFDIILEQSNCSFSWINKRFDSIKMHGTNGKIYLENFCYLSVWFSVIFVKISNLKITLKKHKFWFSAIFMKISNLEFT